MSFSRAQIVNVSKAARAAWDANEPIREACLERNSELSKTKCFDLFRRDELQKAIGVTSYRDASNDDYIPTLAHFHHLAGQDGQALKELLHAEDEPRDRILYLLKDACQDRDLHFPNYPAAIAKNQFKARSLDACSDKQLWKLLFTVRNRRKPAKPKAPAPAPTPQDNGDNPF